MGTPFIAHLEPTPLAWDRTLPAHEQPSRSSIPRTFLDAMTVRQRVFVAEQGVALENEYDRDDPRSCHWVIYASVNQTVAPAVKDPATGAVLQPRKSSTTSLPIGTVRLVPFPHPPHPLPGGEYLDGELIATTTTTTTTTTATNSSNPSDSSSSSGKPTPAKEEQQQQQQEQIRTRPKRAASFSPDRATTYHDGREPYVKLGRLAVLPEFRGRGIARQLVAAAVGWMRQNRSYFDPSPAAEGFEQLGMQHRNGAVPRWNGLICVHAQQSAVSMWEKCGFKVDEGMGTWKEEGIPHVGMFLRVEPETGEPLVK